MSFDAAIKENENCESSHHNEHLCHLQFEGVHFKDKAAYKALVQDAQYICRNCGRTAAKAGNVCDPVSL